MRYMSVWIAVRKEGKTLKALETFFLTICIGFQLAVALIILSKLRPCGDWKEPPVCLRVLYKRSHTMGILPETFSPHTMLARKSPTNPDVKFFYDPRIPLPRLTLTSIPGLICEWEAQLIIK